MKPSEPAITTPPPRRFGVTVGIDIVEIERIRLMLARWGDRFLRRCFTEDEARRARGRPETLAGVIAAKEAFAKATGTGLRGFGWLDVEVTTNPAVAGRPSLGFHRGAAEIADRQGWHSTRLSLTHSAGVAVAVVVALTAGDNRI